MFFLFFKESVKLSGYNGAQEEEIMEKVINSYSDYARDSSNMKTN